LLITQCPSSRGRIYNFFKKHFEEIPPLEEEVDSKNAFFLKTEEF